MRLLLMGVIHTRHRPILDLLPSLLDRGQQLVHVFQESRKAGPCTNDSLGNS